MSKLLEQLGDWSSIHQSIVESHPGLYRQLVEFVQFHRDSYTVYPSPPEVFKAFELCQMKDLRVVIIGQDPYHNGAATGLICF
jgi:uracil-DNA glycosylase